MSATLLDRYKGMAVDLAKSRERKVTHFSSFTNPELHPEIAELMDLEARGDGLTGKSWVTATREMMGGGDGAKRALAGLTAGLGFAGAPLPNTEPVVVPTATTGVTSETNLYTPATTTNADWALLPQGSIRAPQSWLIFASGVFTTTGAQTVAWTSRIGTSATPGSNATLGATGLVSMAAGATVANGLWFYTAQMTVRSPGTSGSMFNVARIVNSNQAAGAVTTSSEALSGNTVATVDTTLQQGYVISVTPSAAGVSITLGNFVLIAID